MPHPSVLRSVGFLFYLSRLTAPGSRNPILSAVPAIRVEPEQIVSYLLLLVRLHEASDEFSGVTDNWALGLQIFG